MLLQYVNGHHAVRQCRDTGDSVSVESKGITLLNCDKYTTTCRDYTCMDDRQGDRVNIVFCKMDDAAKNTTPVFEMAIEQLESNFETSEIHGTDGADTTEYFLHSFYYSWPPVLNSSIILRLVDVTRGAEVWQKSYPSHEFLDVDRFLFGDGFVVVAKIPLRKDADIEIEIIQTQTGKTLANHALCIVSDHVYFYLRVQKQMIIYVNRVQCMGDNFTGFLFDGAAPSKEPEQFCLRVSKKVSKKYRNLKEVVLVGSSHLIACLCPLRDKPDDIQSKLCFIVFDLHAQVEVRRVILNNLAYVGCLGQVLLLRHADGKKKMEVETKLLLCGFNRSLAMLDTLTRLQLQST